MVDRVCSAIIKDKFTTIRNKVGTCFQAELSKRQQYSSCLAIPVTNGGIIRRYCWLETANYPSDKNLSMKYKYTFSLK